MAFSKIFNYQSFKEKFYSEKARTSIVNYYSSQYPHLSEAYIHFLVKDISIILIAPFNTTMCLHSIHRLNYYNRLCHILEKGLTEEEQKKYAWQENLMALQGYRDGNIDFLEAQLDKASKNPRYPLAPVENSKDYLSVANDILKNQATTILSYMHNHLVHTLKGNQQKGIFIAEPPSFFENTLASSTHLKKSISSQEKRKRTDSPERTTPKTEDTDQCSSKVKKTKF